MDSYVVFRLYAIQTILFEWDRVLQHCDGVEYVLSGEDRTHGVVQIG